MKKLLKLILWDFGGVLTKSPLHKFIEYENKFNITQELLLKLIVIISLIMHGQN